MLINLLDINLVLRTRSICLSTFLICEKISFVIIHLLLLLFFCIIIPPWPRRVYVINPLFSLNLKLLPQAQTTISILNKLNYQFSWFYWFLQSEVCCYIVFKLINMLNQKSCKIASQFCDNVDFFLLVFCALSYLINR